MARSYPGEDPRDGLRRELAEELGIDATVGEILDVTFHRYEELDKAVLLLFFEVARAARSPEPARDRRGLVRVGRAEELDPARFPPADVAVLRKVAARLRVSRARIFCTEGPRPPKMARP